METENFQSKLRKLAILAIEKDIKIPNKIPKIPATNVKITVSTKN